MGRHKLLLLLFTRVAWFLSTANDVQGRICQSGPPLLRHPWRRFVHEGLRLQLLQQAALCELLVHPVVWLITSAC